MGGSARKMGGALLVVAGLVAHVLMVPAYALVFIHGIGNVSARLLALVSYGGAAAFLSMVAGWGVIRGRPWAALGLRLLGAVAVLGGLVVSYYLGSWLGLAISLAGLVLLLVSRILV